MVASAPGRTSIKCPNCGTQMSIEKSLEELKCVNCNTPLRRRTARWKPQQTSRTTPVQAIPIAAPAVTSDKKGRKALFGLAGLTAFVIIFVALLIFHGHAPKEDKLVVTEAPQPTTAADVTPTKTETSNAAPVQEKTLVEVIPAQLPLQPQKAVVQVESSAPAVTAEPRELVITRDRLPAGDGESIDSLPKIDHLFKENLDLYLGGKKADYTKKYLAYCRKNDEDPENPDTLMSYVKGQAIVRFLPKPLAEIDLTKSDTPLVLQKYLEAGFGSINQAFCVVRKNLDSALVRRSRGYVSGAVIQAQAVYQDLAAKRVPPCALPLHKVLLGYAELVGRSMQVIESSGDDYVKEKVAVYQLDEAQKQYEPFIEQEVTRLKKLLTQLQAGGGLGIRTVQYHGVTIVSEILRGGAAYRAQTLKVGDCILAIGQGNDGPTQRIAGFSEKAVAGLLRGDPDTIVRLTVVQGPPPKVVTTPGGPTELKRALDNYNQTVNGFLGILGSDHEIRSR